MPSPPLPEAITRAIQEYGNAVCLRDNVTVALDNLRRAIAAELLRRAIDSAEIVDAWCDEKGRRGQAKVQEHLEGLRAQAAALEAGGD